MDGVKMKPTQRLVNAIKQRASIEEIDSIIKEVNVRFPYPLYGELITTMWAFDFENNDLAHHYHKKLDEHKKKLVIEYFDSFEKYKERDTRAQRELIMMWEQQENCDSGVQK